MMTFLRIYFALHGGPPFHRSCLHSPVALTLPLPPNRTAWSCNILPHQIRTSPPPETVNKLLPHWTCLIRLFYTLCVPYILGSICASVVIYASYGPVGWKKEDSRSPLVAHACEGLCAYRGKSLNNPELENKQYLLSFLMPTIVQLSLRCFFPTGRSFVELQKSKFLMFFSP